MTSIRTDRTARLRAPARRADGRTAPAPAPARSPHVSDADLEQAYAKARQQATQFHTGSPNLDYERLSDAASDAVIDAAKVFRPGPRSFPSYAYERVNLALLDVARGRGRQVDAASLDEMVGEFAHSGTASGGDRPPRSDRKADLVPDPAPGPLEMLLLAETAEERAALAAEIRAAVMLLPPFERKVMHFRYWASKSQADVAHLLGISQARVQRTEAAAKERLREMLQPAVDVGCDGC